MCRQERLDLQTGEDEWSSITCCTRISLSLAQKLSPSARWSWLNADSYHRLHCCLQRIFHTSNFKNMHSEQVWSSSSKLLQVNWLINRSSYKGSLQFVIFHRSRAHGSSPPLSTFKATNTHWTWKENIEWQIKNACIAYITVKLFMSYCFLTAAMFNSRFFLSECSYIQSQFHLWRTETAIGVFWTRSSEYKVNNNKSHVFIEQV